MKESEKPVIRAESAQVTGPPSDSQSGGLEPLTGAGCGTCGAALAWDRAVFFMINGPVVLNGPDAPIMELRSDSAIACDICAVLIMRRDVQGLLARWPNAATASGTVLSECAALTLRFLDAVGPPIDLEEWWSLRHPDADA